MERKGNKKTKYLLPTHKGVALITVMPEQIQSPSMTAEWEQKLLDVEKGAFRDTEFMEKIEGMITELVRTYKIIEDAEVLMHEIHKVLRSCFRQAVKWDMMEKNPAVDATVPKAKKQEREIWTAEMLMQALEACDNKMLKIAFHLAFTATLSIGEVLGLTWDAIDVYKRQVLFSVCTR